MFRAVAPSSVAGEEDRKLGFYVGCSCPSYKSRISLEVPESFLDTEDPITSVVNREEDVGASSRERLPSDVEVRPNRLQCTRSGEQTGPGTKGCYRDLDTSRRLEIEALLDQILRVQCGRQENYLWVELGSETSVASHSASH